MTRPLRRPNSPWMILLALSFLGASVVAANPPSAVPLSTDAVMIVNPERVIPEPPVGADKALSTEALSVLTRADYAASERLAALEAWNLAKRKPVQNGFVRPFENAAVVAFDLDKNGQPGVFSKAGGATVWSARVEVERAHRLRLHLAEADLPAGTRMWVRGGDELVAFDLSLKAAEGDLWTPSIGGSSIELIVQLPAGTDSGPRLRIDAVTEIFRLDGSGAPVFDPAIVDKGTECLQDGACFDNNDLAGYDVYQQAVSGLTFVVGGSSFICTGTMVNDSNPSSVIPYLQTANHCFSTQSVASTLEARFDDIALTCNGTFPDINSLPRVNGSTLLATSATTDSTFVRLSANPAGSTGYMGWSTAVVGANTNLYRLSHPLGFPQHYSTYVTVNPFIPCGGVPTSNFIYAQPTLGATAGGSSGASLVDDNGRIRGQLLGACGPDPEDPCNPNNDDVDGRFANFFDQIASFLTDDGGGGNQPCVDSDTTLCLRNNRFQIEGTWRDFEGDTGVFHAVPYTDTSGLIWFFNEDNIEFLIKIINGCNFNGNYWVFFAATTDVEYNVTVTDTQTGAVESYSNPLGNPSPAVTDTFAFATCP